MLEKMKTLARRRDMCVLATVGNGIPHCSLMAYVTDENCHEIYMVTDKNSQKYKNLMENPAVSLLIDTREEHTGPRQREAKAMTVNGVFQEMANDKEIVTIRKKLLERHPHLQTFFDNPQARLLSIKIKSFLLLDGLTDAHFKEI